MDYETPAALGAVGFYKHNGPEIKSLKKDDFYKLNSEERKAIFRKNVPLHASARTKGKAILRRLRSLAPSVGERFELKRDPINNLTMRLWCPGSTATNRPDSYICLSYCWNSSRSSSLNDLEVSLPTSGLMFSAFNAQRKSSRTGLWIDQLCIDQTNPAEKAMSVSAMDAVYRCAERVVVILHDVELPLAQQAFLRSQLETQGDRWFYDSRGLFKHSTEEPPYFEKHPVLKRLLYYILGSSYFTRAWCSHELQMRGKYAFCMPCQPRDPQSQYTEVFHFSSDFLLYLILLSSSVPLHIGSTGENERIRDLREKVGLILRLDNPTVKSRTAILTRIEESSPRHMPSYPVRIREIFSLGAGGDPDLPANLRLCSALLDKSTIVLNILNNGLAIKRNNSRNATETECIEDLYMIGLAANDPLTLCTMGQHFNYGDPTRRLSWLRQPALMDLGCGSERGEPTPCMIPHLAQRIELDPSEEKRWIAIDVFALGQPRPVKEHFRILAQSLVDRCLALDMGRAPFEFRSSFEDPTAEYAGKTDLVSRLMLLTLESMNSWGTGPEYQYWFTQTVFAKRRERFVWTLACILECGPAWIFGTASRCGFPALEKVGRRTFPIVDEYEGGWNIHKLKLMSWAQHELEKTAVNAIMSFANWMVSWGNDGAYGMNSECLPTLYAHGPEGKGHALVYVRPDALVQIVIPTVLLEDHYARLYRVWQLEAKDDPLYERMRRGGGAEWFLRAKAILFTDIEDGDTVASTGSARDGKPGWRYRAGVRIHGPPRSVGDTIKDHLKSMEPTDEDQKHAKSVAPEKVAEATKIHQ